MQGAILVPVVVPAVPIPCSLFLIYLPQLCLECCLELKYRHLQEGSKVLLLLDQLKGLVLSQQLQWLHCRGLLRLRLSRTEVYLPVYNIFINERLKTIAQQFQCNYEHKNFASTQYYIFPCLKV